MSGNIAKNNAASLNTVRRFCFLHHPCTTKLLAFTGDVMQVLDFMVPVEGITRRGVERLCGE